MGNFFFQRIKNKIMLSLIIIIRIKNSELFKIYNVLEILNMVLETIISTTLTVTSAFNIGIWYKE